MSEAPQKTLGKYEIRKELGKGAMGVVYLGFDPGLEREVALKVMAGAIVSDSDLKERFEREAKAVARLQHPNIVTVYDLGYDNTGDGAPFIAMELLKGVDLEERIRKNPLTFREKLEVVAKVCRGLAHAHKNGIVHRDIKPANVFVSNSGEVKIMDFGVARWAQSSHTQTGAILGTADYMSPEQIRGQKVDGRSDIFSVGVILYRLLTNKKPFAGDNIQAVFFKVLNQEAPPLQLPDGKEIPELQAIVEKALSKSEDARYEHADDLADDLLDLIRLYEDVVSEDTVFDTMFDPAAVGDEGSLTGGTGGGSGVRGGTSARVLGGTAGSMARRGTVSGSMGRTSSGGGTMGRTSQMPTAVGRMPSGATGAVRPGTRAPGLGGTSVGIPLHEESSFGKILMAVIAVGLVGFGVYWFALRQPPAEVSAGNSGPPPVSAAELAPMLSEAQQFIENEQYDRAQAQINDILNRDPGNERARSLRDQILDLKEAQANQAASTPNPPANATPAPVVNPSTPPDIAPENPPRNARADQLARDANSAIIRGDLDAAATHIRNGRRLAPNRNEWNDLDTNLNEARANAAADAMEAEVANILRVATEMSEKEDFEGAVKAFDDGIARFPELENNTAILSARSRAVSDLKRAEAATNVVASRQIKRSATTYTPPPGKPDAPRGFDMGGSSNVKRATSAPKFPATVDISLNPETAQDGQLFRMQIVAVNEGNRPFSVKDLEIVSTYGGNATGKGQKIPARTKLVNPNGSAVVYQVDGTWKELYNSGHIEVTVFLEDGAKLTKSISW